MSKQAALRLEKANLQRNLIETTPPDLKEKNIQFMSKEDLMRLQRHFRLGDTWGEIIVPPEWCRRSEAKGSGNYYAIEVLKEYAHSNEDLDLSYATLLRMVLLCFCSPIKVGRHSARLLDITTIQGLSRKYWTPMLKVALRKPLREDGALLARIDTIELPSTTDNTRSRMVTEVRRFRNYASRGLWWDIVQEAPVTKRETTNKKHKREPQKRSENNPYKPLPDEFVLETGKRAVWLIQHIMPQALEAYSHVLKISKEARISTKQRRVIEYLGNFDWDFGNHGPLAAEPFLLNVMMRKTHVEWPPQDCNQLYVLLKVCQSAAYFIVALSGGARGSEILSEQTDCLRESRNGIQLIDGKTYKLEEMFEGKKRDWPLPEIALQAVQHQITLTRLLDQSMGTEENGKRVPMPLWRVIVLGRGHGVALADHYNEYLRDFAERIGTSHLLDKQALTNHRFRKTIARLVALALVNAPKILMDIFGHKDIAMTMHYILANKSIRAEIMQIQKEILAMRVEKAIKKVESNGGPAAKKIEAEVRRIKFVRAREDLQAEDILETVVRMTSVGREWSIVAEGVLCTKMRDQVGPCAAGRSSPNPSKCSSKCDHRLEEADNLNRVDGVLNYIVKNLQIAHAKNEILAVDAFEGQLLAHIKRFDVLYEKWSKHPVVAQVLKRIIVEDANAA